MVTVLHSGVRNPQSCKQKQYSLFPLENQHPLAQVPTKPLFERGEEIEIKIYITMTIRTAENHDKSKAKPSTFIELILELWGDSKRHVLSSDENQVQRNLRSLRHRQFSSQKKNAIDPRSTGQICDVSTKCVHRPLSKLTDLTSHCGHSYVRISCLQSPPEKFFL